MTINLLAANCALSAEVLAAIISAVVSILIGVISGWVTASKAKMNFYSSTVSKERVEWINKTREITSDLIAFLAQHTENNLLPSATYQFEKLRSSLLVRLSPISYVKEKHKYVDTDGKLIDLLESDYSIIRDNKCQIRELITVICKNEWDRIKAEAGGDKNLEKKIKKYDNSVHCVDN